MRHQKLRVEKNCLNCGYMVEERYCSRCGQENQVIHDSAFHLILHYIQDLFHYDGRFWHTIRNLVRKPGQVAMEYIEGKRRQNIEPIKFYVFTSTVFFLLLFFRVGRIELGTETVSEGIYRQRLQNLEQEMKYIQGTPDTALVNHLKEGIYIKVDSIRLAEGDTTSARPQVGDVEIELFNGDMNDTVKEPGFRGWLQYRLSERARQLEEEHGGDERKATTAIVDELFHKLPQLLFLSMPFFALCLQLLYINRDSKNYVDHFIFSTYHYSYLFVLLILYLGVTMIAEKIDNPDDPFLGSGLIWATVLYMIVYLFLSMKRFYGGRWWPLILRFSVLSGMFTFLILILFVLGLMITFIL